MIFTIIQILEKQNQFPDIEKLMSDWLKRLSKVLLVTDKFTVQIKQGYKEAKELWKNDYCRISIFFPFASCLLPKTHNFCTSAD